MKAKQLVSKIRRKTRGRLGGFLRKKGGSQVDAARSLRAKQIRPGLIKSFDKAARNQPRLSPGSKLTIHGKYVG